jgi:phosphopantetheinyl transferase (holo-ACP synthase)
MKPINKDIVKIKNLLNIVDNPTHEDLLYEIVNFLDSEKRFDGIFNIKEASLKTRCRITSDFTEDINQLEQKEYVKKLKYTQYVVEKHLWEQ